MYVPPILLRVFFTLNLFSVPMGVFENSKIYTGLGKLCLDKILVSLLDGLCTKQNPSEYDKGSHVIDISELNISI